MRKWMIVLVCACSLCLTSCINMLEEVFLNRDGSGKYLITMDMGELMSNPMMKGALQETAEEGGAPKELEKDTVIRMIDMAQPGLLTAEEINLAKGMEMRMHMSESKGEMTIVLDMPFKNIDDLAKIGEIMQKIKPQEGDESADPLGGAGMLGGMTSTQKQFEVSKNTFTRLPVAAQMDMMKQMFGGDGEEMEMVKMLFGSATYKTVYHMPGKVKKAKIDGAKIEGNTVTVSNTFLDIMEGKAKLDGQIKFK